MSPHRTLSGHVVCLFVFVCVCVCLCVYSRVGASYVGRPICVCAVSVPLRRVNTYISYLILSRVSAAASLGSDTRSRCQRFESPWRFGLEVTWSVVAASQWRPSPAGWTATPSGCSGSSPRSALYKICANKKIGESEGKKQHRHGHHPEVQSLPEAKKKKRRRRCRPQ